MPRMSRKSYSYHGVNEGETEEAQRLRFQIELEFVQCLASPNYLNYLAQRNYFKEQTFINYLKHLQYWKDPEYAKFIKYPMCLYFLDLLQHENFRKEIVNGQYAKFIDDQMVLHWQHYTRKRVKILETGSQLPPPSVASTTAGGGLSAPVALPTQSVTAPLPVTPAPPTPATGTPVPPTGGASPRVASPALPLTTAAVLNGHSQKL